MELRIIDCLGCTIQGGMTGKMKDEQPNVIEITSREVCSKCGRDITIHAVRVEMDRKIFGEVKYSLTWF